MFMAIQTKADIVWGKVFTICKSPNALYQKHSPIRLWTNITDYKYDYCFDYNNYCILKRLQ